MSRVHIRPDLQHAHQYCVDGYSKTGQWEASSRSLTKTEAIKLTKRLRYYNKKNAKAQPKQSVKPL